MINMMLLKNQQEYQETMNVWKQEVSAKAPFVNGKLRVFQSHIMHWFKQYEDEPAPTTFLDKFYSGRDDPVQVVPSNRSTG
jgi:NADH dehydrogenase (ubiquinone) 1 alpha subcomplex subunit 6